MKSHEIKDMASEKFDEAEAIEVDANRMLQNAQDALQEATERLEKSKKLHADRMKEAKLLYRESNQLYAQAEAMERDERMSGRSVIQTAQRRLEDKMLGVPMAVRAANDSNVPVDAKTKAKIKQLQSKLKQAVSAMEEAQEARQRALDDQEDAEDDGDQDWINEAEDAVQAAYDDEAAADELVEKIEKELAKLEGRKPRQVGMGEGLS